MMTEAHAQRAHATLAPSAAHRWVNCPGSVSLTSGIDDRAVREFEDAADEGTAAHELAAMCLDQGEDADFFRGWWINRHGGFTKHKPEKLAFEVDVDMVDGVQLYLDVARKIAEGADEWGHEEKFETPIEGCWGTCDRFAHHHDDQHLTIVDFKYGRVPVEVKENEQLMLYASGAARRYHNRGVKTIELIIVQPRAVHRDGPVRRWTLSYDELQTFVARAREAAAQASSPNPPFRVGSHCKYCPAGGFCSALRNYVEEAVMENPEKFTLDELASSLRRAAVVSDWVRSVEKLARAQATRGAMPPGFKFVAAKSHRKWKDEAAAINTLTMLGVDRDALYTQPELKTPAQAEKELPRNARGIMGTLTVRPQGALYLVAEEDPRPAADPGWTDGLEKVEGIE